jgi:hypothetical protein
MSYSTPWLGSIQATQAVGSSASVPVPECLPLRVEVLQSAPSDYWSCRSKCPKIALDSSKSYGRIAPSNLAILLNCQREKSFSQRRQDSLTLGKQLASCCTAASGSCCMVSLDCETLVLELLNGLSMAAPTNLSSSSRRYTPLHSSRLSIICIQPRAHLYVRSSLATSPMRILP